MITAQQIGAALNLTGVTLSVSPQGLATITADQPVTDAQQALVQAWHAAGQVNAVPAFVRTGQLRQWLNRKGLLNSVEAKFETPALWPDELTRIDAKIRWEYEVNVVRADPLVVSLGHSLGLSDAQLDAAFLEISLIP